MAPFSEGREPVHESLDEFEKRVKRLTGMDLNTIPRGEPGDALFHQIAVRDSVYVVGYGTPDIDSETGEATYHEYRVIDLKNKHQTR